MMKEELEYFISNNYIQKDLTLPIFTTKNLALVSTEIYNKFDYNKPTKCIKYTIPKNKLARRSISIPNPLAYIKLSYFLLEKWKDINDFYSDSYISHSRPINCNESNYIKLEKEKGTKNKRKFIHLSSSYSFILKTDLSRYFSTIYTHSISWALHSKKESKKKRKPNQLLGNKIDKLSRDLCDGQTLGIPVGPFSSNIISEIIGTAIDIKILEEFPNIEGYRYVDDYYLFFNYKEEAEECLTFIRKTVSDFELELNNEKTQILEIPFEIEPNWIYKIRTFKLRESIEERKNDVISYFNLVFDLSKKHNSDSVVKYGIKRSTSFNISPGVWEVYESLLLQALSYDSRCIQEAIEIILKIDKHKLYRIDKKKVKNFIQNSIKKFSLKGYNFEISWLLYLTYHLNINLDKGINKLLEISEDNFVIILSLYLERKNLVSKLNKENWEEIMKIEEFYQENWLLIYEGIRNNFLNAKVTNSSNNDFISYLLNNNIKFIDIDLTPNSISIDFLDDIKRENAFKEESHKNESSNDDYLDSYI